MAKVLVTDSKLTAVADAIRDKLSSTDSYKLDDMPQAIESISGGGEADYDDIWNLLVGRPEPTPIIPTTLTGHTWVANDTIQAPNPTTAFNFSGLISIGEYKIEGIFPTTLRFAYLQNYQDYLYIYAGTKIYPSVQYFQSYGGWYYRETESKRITNLGTAKIEFLGEETYQRTEEFIEWLVANGTFIN